MERWLRLAPINGGRRQCQKFFLSLDSELKLKHLKMYSDKELITLKSEAFIHYLFSLSNSNPSMKPSKVAQPIKGKIFDCKIKNKCTRFLKKRLTNHFSVVLILYSYSFGKPSL